MKSTNITSSARIGRGSAPKEYAWIEALSADELRELRPIAELGAQGRGDEMVARLGAEMDGATGRLSRMRTAWIGRPFTYRWSRALVRINERLAGRSAAKVATVPAKPSAAKPAPEPRGLARTIAALKAQIANTR